MRLKSGQVLTGHCVTPTGQPRGVVAKPHSPVLWQARRPHGGGSAVTPLCPGYTERHSGNKTSLTLLALATDIESVGRQGRNSCASCGRDVSALALGLEIPRMSWENRGAYALTKYVCACGARTISLCCLQVRIGKSSWRPADLEWNAMPFPPRAGITIVRNQPSFLGEYTP